ncbi:alginate lyase family protein [Cardiobacteriaceae bacterium TAE3-ERU3]|nr:alginate lyase family protein [Cardiobacteriaceae bacterium TAE3-ERU3]
MKHFKMRILAMILGVTSGVAIAAENSKPILLDESQWQALREKPDRYADLLRGCEGDIDKVARPVEIFVPQAHYGKYGENNQESEVKKQISSDGWRAYRAALCYKLGDDVRFARQAQQILDAWGGTLQSVEGMPGKAWISFNMPAYVIAGYLVQDVEGWDDSQWQTFLREVIAPLSVAYSSDNNHGSWGVLLNTTIAAYLQDDNLLREAQSRWQELLQEQVDNEGNMSKEVCRSDTTNWCGGPTKGIKGIAYTHYALLPTTVSAQILDQQGYNVWQTAAGEALGKAYARAAQWTLRPETFPYYERNNGKLQGVENGDYFSVLQRHYPNDDGAAVLEKGGQGMDFFHLTLLFPEGQ